MVDQTQKTLVLSTPVACLLTAALFPFGARRHIKPRRKWHRFPPSLLLSLASDEEHQRRNKLLCLQQYLLKGWLLSNLYLALAGKALKLMTLETSSTFYAGSKHLLSQYLLMINQEKRPQSYLCGVWIHLRHQKHFMQFLVLNYN